MNAPLSDWAPELAPHGLLRASINLGNPILAARNAAGQPQGVSVDLASELARQLGVEWVCVVHETAAASVQTVREARADVGFFAIDPQRGQGIGFSSPYVLIEGSYAVHADSPFTDNGDVDRPGVRIVVGSGSAYDLYLSRVIRQAELVRAPSSPAVVDHFLAHGCEVAAGVKQQLAFDLQRHGGLRMLPGRFMVIEQAMGLPASLGAAARTVLAEFVERMKASGFVADALKRHGIDGASVAPPSA